MNYEIPENETEKHHKPCEDKTRIVVARDHPSISRRLIQLISKEAKPADCVELDNTNQALEAIKERQADFAIFFSQDTTGIRLVAKIKFPNLPLRIGHLEQ